MDLWHLCFIRDRRLLVCARSSIKHAMWLCIFFLPPSDGIKTTASYRDWFSPVHLFFFEPAPVHLLPATEIEEDPIHTFLHALYIYFVKTIRSIFYVDLSKVLPSLFPCVAYGFHGGCNTATTCVQVRLVLIFLCISLFGENYISHLAF